MSLLDHEAETQIYTNAAQEREAFDQAVAEEVRLQAQTKGMKLADAILSLVNAETPVGPKVELFPFSIEGGENDYLNLCHEAVVRQIRDTTQVDVADLPDGVLLTGTANSLLRETVYPVVRIDGTFQQAEQPFGFNYTVAPNRPS